MSYMEIDYRTPRERIDETLLRRVLDETGQAVQSLGIRQASGGNERDGGCASGQKILPEYAAR